tara:strand:+ start:5899 stop:8595 length:2697 start_codon:yes stop_codon:yes gene_type:complete
MKNKIILVIGIIGIMITQLSYAGYTLLDKNRLIFGDGGGFEAYVSPNTNSNPIMVIRALPYNEPGEQYRSKGIDFVAPPGMKSILYEVATDTFGDETQCAYDSGCPRFLVGKTPRSNDVISTNIEVEPIPINLGGDPTDPKKFLLNSENNFWKNEKSLLNWTGSYVTMGKNFDDENKPTPNKEWDKVHLIFGDSVMKFIGINIEVPADNTPAGNTTTANINAYKIITAGSGDYEFVKDPVHFGQGNVPIYIGRNEKDDDGPHAGVPILTLIPEYYADGLAKISINTNRVMKDITVEGGFNITGQLVSNSEFGILKYNMENYFTSEDVLAGSTKTLVCEEFEVEFVPHNFMFVGTINGKANVNRAPEVTIWLELFFKNSYGNYVQEEAEDITAATKRIVEGSFSQSSLSITTQYVANLDSNRNTYTEDGIWSEKTEWKVCVEAQASGSGAFLPDGDQNQILILGLPGGKLDSNIPEPPVPEGVELIETAEIVSASADKPLLQENAILFTPEDHASLPIQKSKIAGITTVGDFMIFTDTRTPTILEAENIRVDKRYNISVLKIIDKKTEALFNIKDANGSLAFIIPEDDETNDFGLYKGPYGKSFTASSEGDTAGTVTIDTDTTLTEFGIATYPKDSKLVFGSGIKVGNDDQIQFVEKQGSANIIMNDNSATGYALHSPNAELAFTGVYTGNVGKMYYLRCLKDATPVANNLDTSKPNALIIPKDDSATASCADNNIYIEIPADDLYFKGLPNLGYKFVIMSVVAARNYGGGTSTGTSLEIELISNTATAILNNQPCTGKCETGRAVFRGDTGANSTFTHTNIATVEKIKGDLDASKTVKVSIKFPESHLELKLGGDADDFKNDGTNNNDGTANDGRSNAPNNINGSAAIWILAFPDALD